MKPYCAAIITIMVIASCSNTSNTLHTEAVVPGDSIAPLENSAKGQPITAIETGKTKPAELVAFARTLAGTPYKYGSTDPKLGFDCSGFVTYVFNHFGISVPRTSADFTSVRREIDVKEARPGDLILFTGTDSTTRVVGHMGIIVTNNDSNPTFIHATSGKAFGVTETQLNPYYQGRYVKTIRIFPDGH